MPSTDQEIATTRTFVVSTSHNAAGDVLYRRSRQVASGEDLHVGTVARESAEARQWRAHLDQLVEDLEPTIGKERYLALDAAVGNHEVAVRMEYLARLTHMGVEAMDTDPPGLLVLSPTVRASVPQPPHSPDTCRCCRARWRYRVWRILASIAVALALGALLGRRTRG